MSNCLNLFKKMSVFFYVIGFIFCLQNLFAENFRNYRAEFCIEDAGIIREGDSAFVRQFCNQFRLVSTVLYNTEIAKSFIELKNKIVASEDFKQVLEKLKNVPTQIELLVALLQSQDFEAMLLAKCEIDENFIQYKDLVQDLIFLCKQLYLFHVASKQFEPLLKNSPDYAELMSLVPLAITEVVSYLACMEAGIVEDDEILNERIHNGVLVKCAACYGRVVMILFDNQAFWKFYVDSFLSDGFIHLIKRWSQNKMLYTHLLMNFVISKKWQNLSELLPDEKDRALVSNFTDTAYFVGNYFYNFPYKADALLLRDKIIQSIQTSPYKMQQDRLSLEYAQEIQGFMHKYLSVIFGTEKWMDVIMAKMMSS